MIPSYSSDHDLLLSLKKGNEHALESLFHSHYEELCHKANKYVLDDEISRDLVQELFITIWDKRKRIEIKSSWRAYLSTAVKNRALNYLRGLHHFTSIEKIESIDESEDIHLDLEGKELDSILKEAIVALPPKRRSVFLLSRRTEMNYAEIAKELNISKKTVEYHVGTALKQIQEFLKHHWTLMAHFLISIFF